jgi:hypothetical protein
MLGLDYRPKEASSTLLAAKLAPMSPVTRIFSISSDSIYRLKDRCSAEAAAHDATKWVSTADSVAAILWSSIIIRARTRPRQQSVTGEAALSTLMTAMAKNLLAHFHHACKGEVPFQKEFDWSCPSARYMAELSVEEVALVKTLV